MGGGTGRLLEAILNANGKPSGILFEQPIHETGTYMVDVEIGGGVTASVKTIVAEEK